MFLLILKNRKIYIFEHKYNLIMGFEDNLQKSMFMGQQERTFIDKVLAKDDINAIRELIKKPTLERSDVLEILYLISGVEAKLLNYSEWDRYIQLKFFVWIREFAKILEILFDYEDELAKKNNYCVICKHFIKNTDFSTKSCVCKEPQKELILTDRTKRLLNNNKLLMQHNLKFLVDLYVNMERTSMSIKGTGFIELIKNKFEVAYHNMPQGVQPEQARGGFFGLGGKK